MKKFFYLSMIAASLASCTNEKDEAIIGNKEVKVVDATIGYDMIQSESNTRAYLGSVESLDGNGIYTIAHKFEVGDKLYIHDYSGEYLFEVYDAGQTQLMKGRWGDIDGAEHHRIFATFPSKARRSELTVDSNNHPVMHFNLPNVQTTRLFDTGEKIQVTYDTKAGLAFACAGNKEANLWFLPVVTYLYFYSKEPTCTITSTVDIVGDYDVVYDGVAGTGTNAGTGTEYNNAAGLHGHLAYSASEKTVTCHGEKLDGHKSSFVPLGFPDGAYEYMICIKPGTYAAESITITAGNSTEKFKNKVETTLLPSWVYFLGGVDKL